MARAKFDEVLEAFEFVSAGQPMENEAFLSRDTGVIHWRSDYDDKLEPLPGDIDEGEKYIAMPHKYDLDLGKHLVLRFAEESMSDALDEVRDIFSRRGAYARFKDLLEHRGMLQQWDEYEAAAKREALQEWCRENGVEIDG